MPVRRDKPGSLLLLPRTLRVAIAETTTDHLRVADKLAMRDFEDALQVSAALAWGADFIVTRNLKDFKKSPIHAISPGEAVRRRLALDGP